MPTPKIRARGKRMCSRFGHLQLNPLGRAYLLFMREKGFDIPGFRCKRCDSIISLGSAVALGSRDAEETR